MSYNAVEAEMGLHSLPFFRFPFCFRHQAGLLENFRWRLFYIYSLLFFKELASYLIIYLQNGVNEEGKQILVSARRRGFRFGEWFRHDARFRRLPGKEFNKKTKPVFAKYEGSDDLDLESMGLRRCSSECHDIPAAEKPFDDGQGMDSTGYGDWRWYQWALCTL